MDFQDWDDAEALFSPSPRPSPIKGEGDSVGCFVLLSARHHTSGLRIKSAMSVFG